MSDHDDLVWLIADALAADDPEASCAHNLAPVADAVIDAGWVSPERLAEANRRIEWCQENRRHTVERLVDRYHRATDARDSLAAVVDRVRTLCDELEQAETADQRDHHADDLRAALDGQKAR